MARREGQPGAQQRAMKRGVPDGSLPVRRVTELCSSDMWRDRYTTPHPVLLQSQSSDPSSFATFSPSLDVKSAIITFPPDRTRRDAVALPNPEAAPVTMATTLFGFMFRLFSTRKLYTKRVYFEYQSIQNVRE